MTSENGRSTKRATSLALTIALALSTTFAGAFALPAIEAQAAPAPIDRVDYFDRAYGTNLGADSVFDSVTYQRLQSILASSGKHVVLFGGPENPSTQAAIATIQAKAEAYGVEKIYHFNPRLSGDLGSGIDITATGYPYSDTYWSASAGLIGTYLKNINPDYKSDGTYLFIYDQNGRYSLPVKAIENEVLLKATDLVSGALPSTYAASVDSLFASLPGPATAKTESTLSQYDFFADKWASARIDAADEQGFRLQAITFPELVNLLKNENGAHNILVSGSWCGDSRAAIPSISRQAISQGTGTVYIFDFRLDGRTSAFGPTNADFPYSSTNFSTAYLVDNWLNPSHNLKVGYNNAPGGKYLKDGEASTNAADVITRLLPGFRSPTLFEWTRKDATNATVTAQWIHKFTEGAGAPNTTGEQAGPNGASNYSAVVSAPGDGAIHASDIRNYGTDTEPINIARYATYPDGTSQRGYADYELSTGGFTASARLIGLAAVQPYFESLSSNGPTGRPGTPAAPTIEVGATPQSLKVSWVAPDNGGEVITGYTITLSNGISAEAGASETSVAFADLPTGVAYTATVQAHNANGDSAQSAASRSLGAPSAPAVPTLSSSTHGSINITWVAPTATASITGYTVSVTKAAAGGIAASTTPYDVAADETTKVVTGLETGSYTATVVAKSLLGNSSASGRSTALVLGAPAAPEAPTLVQDADSIQVTWVAPHNGNSPITGYTVTLSNDTTALAPKNVAGTELSTTFDDIAAGSYTATVVATNAYGNSEASAAATAIGVSIPSAPTAPTLAADDGNVTVSWIAPDSGSSPLVGYVVTLSGKASVNVPASETEYTFKDVEKGSYTATVVAKNAVGSSAASPASAVIELSVPTAVATPTIVVGEGTVTVSWVAPANGGSALTGYTITLTGQAPIEVAAGITSYTFKDLPKGSYTATVVAKNGYGVAATAPATLAVVTKTNVHATVAPQISVDWSNASKAAKTTQSTTIKVTVAKAEGQTAIPVGTIDVSVGTAKIISAILDATGAATITIPAQKAGSHDINVAFTAADPTDHKSIATTKVATLTVTKETPVAKVTVKSVKAGKKATVTVAFSKTAANKFPTGKVTIKVNKKSYKAKINAKGVAKVTTKKITKKGTYKASVTYAATSVLNKLTKSASFKVK